MSKARKAAPDRRKCRRCGLKAFEHVSAKLIHDLERSILRCRDGQLFQTQTKRPTHASQSFSADEIKLWKQILVRLNSGQDCSVLTRSEVYGKLWIKINRMDEKLQREKAAAAE